MPSFRPSPAVRRGLAALPLILACAGVGDPAAAQVPVRRAGIRGVSNPASTVCARDGAGATWCTVADSAGKFGISGAGGAPGTATRPLPRSGTVTVFNPDCERAGMVVDRGGARRSGGPWLNVRCRPEGCMRAPPGLLAYYAFDEENRDSAVDRPNAAAPAALRLWDAARHGTGRVLGGLRLDGDGWAGGGSGKNVGTGDFSIALWVRFKWRIGDGFFETLLDKRDSDPIRGYHLVLTGDGPLVQLADGGRFGGWYNYDSMMGSTRLADGRWHFLVVTVERASSQGIRWYLDSEPAGVPADPTGRRGSLSSASRLYVGRHAFHGADFRGSVDELQIFNRVLTPVEVGELFARPTCR